MYVHNIILYIWSRVYYYKEIIGDYLWLWLDYCWINHCYFIVHYYWIIISIKRKKKKKYQLFIAVKQKPQQIKKSICCGQPPKPQQIMPLICCGFWGWPQQILFFICCDFGLTAANNVLYCCSFKPQHLK